MLAIVFGSHKARTLEAMLRCHNAGDGETNALDPTLGAGRLLCFSPERHPPTFGLNRLNEPVDE